MSNHKKFAVWMDGHHATIAGETENESGKYGIIAHVKGEENSPNSNEKHSNHNEQNIQGKFFKEISSHLTNATHVHITGTGQAQEQFIHYLAAVPQFKNTITNESTSNKMSDEKFISFVEGKM